MGVEQHVFTQSDMRICLYVGEQEGVGRKTLQQHMVYEDESFQRRMLVLRNGTTFRYFAIKRCSNKLTERGSANLLLLGDLGHESAQQGNHVP